MANSRIFAFLFVFAVSLALPAYAHHEAMFGPQSSAVLSPGAFFSAQLFDRVNGRGRFRHGEMTMVFSAGMRPLRRSPLSMALVVPFTRDSTTGMGSTFRMEDAVISGRYRVNANGIARALGVEESYVMGVGGIEIPTGNMDHPSGHGPFGQIAAGLFSVETRPIAGIAYAYYHHTGVHNGNRAAGNMFAGSGIAYTPVDNESSGKLFSLQLGMSYERTFAEEEMGQRVENSGSSGVFLHPGLVWSTTPHIQFFTLFSMPITQKFRSLDDRQLFRVGGGMIFIFGD